MTRKSVLLPAPLRPMTPTRSPGRDLEVDVLEGLEVVVDDAASGGAGSCTP